MIFKSIVAGFLAFGFGLWHGWSTAEMFAIYILLVICFEVTDIRQTIQRSRKK